MRIIQFLRFFLILFTYLSQIMLIYYSFTSFMINDVLNWIQIFFLTHFLVNIRFLLLYKLGQLIYRRKPLRSLFFIQVFGFLIFFNQSRSFTSFCLISFYFYYFSFMAQSFSKLKKGDSFYAQTNYKRRRTLPPYLDLADLMRFIFLMMMGILVPILDKYLLKNSCIQVTMIPQKVIPVNIVLTLTLGSPSLSLFLLLSPTTSYHRTRRQQWHSSKCYFFYLPNLVAASVHTSPPSDYISYLDPGEYAFNYFALDFVRLEAKILKQGHDIATPTTRFGKVHARLIPLCNILAKKGE